MRIVIAPDSFKESLPADKVAYFLQKGLEKSLPKANVKVLPLADGGEGLRAILTPLLGLETTYQACQDMWGQEKLFPYAHKEKMALVEAADFLGLSQIDASERKPLDLSSKGLGQMLYFLLCQGYEDIYLGLGGTGTHDGGLGLLEGLGYQLLDLEGHRVEGLGRHFSRIDRILPPSELTWDRVRLHLLVDVENPLTGPQGAGYVFAGQKGLPASQIPEVDRALEKLYQRIAPQVISQPGAGAAGGIAAALLAFTGARIQSGIDQVLDLLEFEEELKGADLLILGEGRFDHQSLKGKAVMGAARRAPQGLPVLLVCGNLDSSLPAFPIENIGAAFSLLQEFEDKEAVLAKAPQYLEAMGQKIGYLLNLSSKQKEQLS